MNRSTEARAVIRQEQGVECGRARRIVSHLFIRVCFASSGLGLTGFRGSGFILTVFRLVIFLTARVIHLMIT